MVHVCGEIFIDGMRGVGEEEKRREEKKRKDKTERDIFFDDTYLHL
jgi:hypothetical protein